MKVTIFTNNFHPRVSGVAVAVMFQEEALRSLGVDTMIVAPDYAFGEELKGPKVHRVTSVAITQMKVSMPLPFLDNEEIRQDVQDFAPDLIHVHHPFWLGKAGMELADELQVPLVYTFHTLYDFFVHYLLLDTDSVRQLVRDYVARFANRCDLVITPTAPIRNYLIKQMGVTTPVEAIPTGIDFSRFDRVSPEDLQKMKKDYNLDRFDKILVNVGRIAKEKNVHLIVEALAVLLQQGYNTAVVMAGDGPELGALQKEAQRLEVDDHLILTGFLDQQELVKVYLIGDIFLFPSDSDTQGIVLYEARAAGMPVIAADSLAARAIVEPGKNGLFTTMDARDFARQIIKILEEPEKFNAPFDRSAFSKETIGKKYKHLYQELITRGRKKLKKGEENILKGVLGDLKDIL